VRKRRSVSEINVVPYIDVMLVLLIIFMVTAPLLKQGVDVDLPTAPANPLDVESPEPIVITVDREGQMYLSTALNPDSGISAESLVKQVRWCAAMPTALTRMSWLPWYCCSRPMSDRSAW
jgi:biopolymer transport protein TolR